MKIPSFALLVLTVVTSPYFKCKNHNLVNHCYKGRLEVKGMCMNYTIKLLQGDIDTSRMEPEWQDSQTGKTHQNVFGLSNPCTFPETIKEGDKFYFTITESSKKNCMVCMAYYPTPDKKLNIEVSKTPCK